MQPTLRARPAAVIRAVAAVMVAALVASGCSAPGRDTGAAAPRTTSGSGGGEGARKPNVLVIVTDDQRADSMGVMRDTLRLIADEGVSFPNGYATTPACCPSRASIFTGRYAHSHGVRTNDGSTTDNLDHESTLQAYLQEEGYTTALYGKYLNGWDRTVNPPHFDRWAFFAGSQPRQYYYDNQWNVQGDIRVIRRYSTRFIQGKVLDFLGSGLARRAPWLTFVTTPAPHGPFLPQERYSEAEVPAFERNPAVEEDDLSDKPAYVQAADRPASAGERAHLGQLRTLLSVDDLVESVFAKLAATGQADNTLVFYLSDNGHMHLEHGLTGKTTPYQDSVRIPMFMRFPGHVDPGTSDDRLVATIDVAPTVLDALGLEPPEEPAMDGRSLLDHDWARDRLLLEYFSRAERATPDWASTLTVEDQYVEYYEPDAGSRVSFREYYDLVADGFQLENLLGPGDPADDPADLVVRSQQLARDRTCSGTTGASACP